MEKSRFGIDSLIAGAASELSRRDIVKGRLRWAWALHLALLWPTRAASALRMR
ncbi:MAG: hypothetical protein R2839_02500 [Thermomicrobiales bacterium]